MKKLNKLNNSNHGGRRFGAGRPGQQVAAGPDLERGKLRWRWWADILTDDERSIYRCLRRAALDDEPGGARPLLEALGGGHATKLAPILGTLESYGFIVCARWGRLIPRDVEVHAVPPPPSSKKERVRLEAKAEADALRVEGPSPAAVQKFIRWFVAEWEQCFKEAHPTITGAQSGMVRNLLHQRGSVRLQQMATHWFKIMDDSSFTLGAFTKYMSDGTIPCDYGKSKREHDAVLVQTEEGKRWAAAHPGRRRG